MDKSSAVTRVKPFEDQSVNLEDVYDDPGSVITLPNQYLEPVVPQTVHNQLNDNVNSSSRRSSIGINDNNQRDGTRSSSPSSTSRQGNSKENEQIDQNKIWSTGRHERQKWLAYNNTSNLMIPYSYQEFRIAQPIFTAHHDAKNCEKERPRELRTMSFKVTIILCGAVTVLTVLVTIFVAVYYGMMIPTTIT